MTGRIRILYVADGSKDVERCGDRLEGADSRFEVVAESDPESVLDRLEADRIDCVVSAYRLSDGDGITLLEAVREDRVDFPFVLFVEDGSEAIASEAISKGVTDYVRRDGVEDPYERLVTGVRDAIDAPPMEGGSAVYRRRFEAVFDDPKMLVGLLSPDGRLCKVNSTAMEYVDVDRDAVLDEPFWATPWWPDEVRADVKEWVERAATGEYVEYETDHPRPDGGRYSVEGTIRPVMDGEAVTSLIVSARDVTDRRERARELELKNRSMDEAPIGILITDPSRADNPIVYANERFEELTGYTEADVVGRNPRFLQGSETDPETVAEMRAAIEAEEPVSVELRNYRRDGTQFWNRVTISPVRNDEGEVTHYVGFQQDVTERKQREQHLQVLYRIFRHNLRNGVNVVDGYAARIQEHLSDSHEPVEVAAAEEAATTIREKASELADIAGKTRRLKRINAASRAKTIPVSELFARVHDRIRDTYSTGVIDLSFPDPDVSVPRPLEIALLEAVENAFEHHDGECPHVELACEVLAEGDTRLLKVRIADDGPGIPPNERTPIETGEETTLEHASSVGLWLIKWTVETLESDLAIADDDPRGSVVTIILPLPEEV